MFIDFYFIFIYPVMCQYQNDNLHRLALSQAILAAKQENLLWDR